MPLTLRTALVSQLIGARRPTVTSALGELGHHGRLVYVLAAVGIAMAVVLFIFVGVWGDLVWIVAAAITLVAGFIGAGRTVTRARTKPSGTTRKSRGNAETANERVGQP